MGSQRISVAPDAEGDLSEFPPGRELKRNKIGVVACCDCGLNNFIFNCLARGRLWFDDAFAVPSRAGKYSNIQSMLYSSFPPIQWEHGAKGVGMRPILLWVVVLCLSLPAPPLVAQVLYEDFSAGIRNSNDGTPLYFAYTAPVANVCPNQTGAIENGMWKEQTLNCQGSNDLYWYVDRIGLNWTVLSSGFWHDYMFPGQTWNASANRLSFQWRCDYPATFYGGGNVQFGTFIKDPNDGNTGSSESNNWHFYHFLSMNQQPFRWIYATFSDKPQHQRSISDSETLPPNPTTMPAYYQYMTDSYMDFQPAATVNYGTCYFDNLVFNTVTGEPEYYVSSTTGQYTGAHYEISWQSPLPTVLTYEISYSTSGSLKTLGFSNGTSGGTVQSGGDAYVGMIWASPMTAQSPNGMYVGIRPHMLVQSATAGSTTALEVDGHSVNVGDTLSCQNMSGLIPSSFTTSVSTVTDWQNIIVATVTSGTYSGGGWCKATSNSTGFTEVYVPPDPTYEAPMAPVNMNAGNPSTNSITLSFTPDPSSTSTLIERSVVGSTVWTMAGKATGSSFVDTGLAPATTYQYRLSGTNSNGTSGPTLLFATSTTMASPNAPVIQSTILPSGILNTAYSFQLYAAGGTPPYTWSVSSGSLPAGLTVASSGLITGTPTQITTLAGAPFLVAVADKNGVANSVSETISVNAALPVTDAMNYPPGTLASPNWSNINASQTLVASGSSVNSYNNQLATYLNSVAWYGNDQWAQIALVAPPTTGRAGVGVRMAQGVTPFACVADTTHVCISQSSVSGYSQTDTCVDATVQAGNVIRAEAAGGTLSCKLNGTPMISGPISTTGGRPGIYTYSTGALANYSSGDLPSRCDLNNDGMVTASDALVMINRAVGPQPCAGSLTGAANCTVVDVQREIAAALGGACVTGP